MACRGRRSVFAIFFATIASAASAAATVVECPPELSGLGARPAIAIVNPYSAGARLAPVFQRRGLPVYYVLSGEEPAALLKNSFRPSQFVDGYTLPSPREASGRLRSPEALQRERAAAGRWLEDRGVRHVIAGAEGSVGLADALSEGMGLPTTNGTALSEAREDKVVMARRIVESGLGLRSVPTVVAQGWLPGVEAEAAAWLRKGAVVVKPIHSAGTDDVYVCTSLAEVEAAIRKIVGKVNLLGVRNWAAVVQPFVHGTEYNLDVVVSNGVARIVWIWRYTLEPSPTSAHVVKHVDLIDPESEEGRTIGDWPLLAARALGIQWGPLHLELFVDRGGEVTFLEAGARVGGVLGPPTAAATDTDIFEEVADAYLDPGKFALRGKRPYRLLKQARVVALNNFQRRRRVYRPPLDAADSPERKLRGLEGFFDLSLNHAHDAVAPVTGSIATALGFLQLVDADPAVIERSTNRVWNWQQKPEGFLTRPEAITAE